MTVTFLVPPRRYVSCVIPRLGGTSSLDRLDPGIRNIEGQERRKLFLHNGCC